MTFPEMIAFWGATFGYTVALMLYLAALIFKRDRLGVFGFNLMVGAFAAHTFAIAWRWYAVSHPPVVSRYENNLAGAWFAIVLLLTLDRRLGRENIVNAIILPVAIVMLGFGVMTGPELTPLAPNFKSLWLWVHVLFAWFAYSSFAVSGGLGLIYLLKGRTEGGRLTGLMARLPERPILEDINMRFVFFGFISQTLMLVTGSIWANGLWGSYWQWDPVETWSLVTWLTYAVVLHLRWTLGWKGPRIAWLTLGAVATIFITFWGIGFISDLHIPLLK